MDNSFMRPQPPIPKAEKAPPRLSLIITTGQQVDLRKYLNWGDRRAIFDTVIDDLIHLAKTNPYELYDLAHKRKHIWEVSIDEPTNP